MRGENIVRSTRDLPLASRRILKAVKDVMKVDKRAHLEPRQDICKERVGELDPERKMRSRGGRPLIRAGNKFAANPDDN